MITIYSKSENSAGCLSSLDHWFCRESQNWWPPFLIQVRLIIDENIQGLNEGTNRQIISQPRTFRHMQLTPMQWFHQCVS